MFDYLVWCEELGQREISAFLITDSHEKNAVNSWALRFDGLVCDGAFVAVSVKSVVDGITNNYKVSCDLMPQYTVKKVTK